MDRLSYLSHWGCWHECMQGEKMMPSKQEKAFSAFYESARHNKILREDTTLMIHLATAIAVGCGS
jgi:hypothetical protein